MAAWEASPVVRSRWGSFQARLPIVEGGLSRFGTKCRTVHEDALASILKGTAGTSTSRHGVMRDAGGLGDLALGVDCIWHFVRFLTTCYASSTTCRLIRLRSRRNRLLQPQRQLRPLVG